MLFNLKKRRIMTHKQSKKGKIPAVIDTWLDTLGYFRKNIAFDETCLFRAVAEQIYASQLHHEQMRKECVNYARDNYKLFKDIVLNRREFFEHLDKLMKHMVVCGELELHIISHCYKYDIVLFNGANQKQKNVTDNKFNRNVLLCQTAGDHYDSVYKKEYIAVAGFCQSMVYSLIYERVLMIPNVQNIVKSMLYDKISANNNFKGDLKDDKEVDGQNTSTSSSSSPSSSVPVSSWAPFPYKVAKALDPTIYRNIEYDTWIELRKELRLGDWYNGDDNLTLGTRCKLKTNDTIVLCYLQKFLKEENKCVVYITSLAEKRIVHYNDLSPEDDAKPWPLPYRFRKNQDANLPASITEINDINKSCKKKKEKKKHSKISGENHLSLDIPKNNSVQLNVSLYEGCPLQIQKSPQKLEAEAVVTESSVLPTNTQYEDKWIRAQSTMESSEWNTESGAQTFNAFNSPKEISSFTPDGTFSSDQYVYYGLSENYNTCNTWQDGGNNNNNVMMMQNSSSMETETVQQQTDRFNYVYCNDNRMNSYTNQPATILTPVTDSPIYTYPTSPTVIDMYHPPPIYNQPISPMIYATPDSTPSEQLNIPLPMYSPTIAYVYPPQTATPTWYPHSINSHGFVFPTPVSAQNYPNRY